MEILQVTLIILHFNIQAYVYGIMYEKSKPQFLATMVAQVTSVFQRNK